MLRALSTHVFLRQRLHPGLLDTLARGGAQAIEVFAARQHFDYTSRQHIKEIADWFQSSEVKPHSLHAPIYADSDMGRGGMPAINVVHHEKSRRIDGMDEVKRALEAAEILHYQFLVLHIGDRDSEWDERALENALTAIEHLKAFGGPLGVKLLLENIQNDVTTPAHLVEIIRVGHFANVGVCFDIGHAHLMAGRRSIARNAAAAHRLDAPARQSSRPRRAPVARRRHHRMGAAHRRAQNSAALARRAA